MIKGEAAKTVNDVLSALQDGLGKELIAFYLYGTLASNSYQPGLSDVNLLAVVEDGLDLHLVRKSLQPVWRRHGSFLCPTPVIATRSAIKRHLKLDPILAGHLADVGVLLYGAFPLPEVPASSSIEQLARLAHQAMTYSAALAPSLMAEKEVVEALGKLRDLVWQLFNRQVDPEETAAGLLGLVQQEIGDRLVRHREIAWPDQVASNPPPLVDDLRSIYEVENRLVLLLPDLPPEQMADRLTTIDWQEVANRVDAQYRSLRVTTPKQLRLIIQYDAAADYYLQNYDHAWGLDPLAGIRVSSWRVYRDLARLPSDAQLILLPHAYITAQDPDLAMLVHDFQNKLLNIQLRSELMCRLDDKPVVIPPTPLPGQDAPMHVRIDAINHNLGWWADYYSSSMDDALQRAS